MAFLFRLLRLLPLLACGMVMPLHAEDDSQWNYHLGKGLHLGNSGIWLGGYANLQVEDLKSSSWRAQLNDLSLFVGGEWGSWQFFSELELGDSLDMGNGEALTTHQAYFNLERFYLDYHIDNAFTIRGGKFLTPIGRWNQIHAAPLVWTTSSPLIVDGPFPMHVTGGMVYGNLEAFDKLWGYIVYGGGYNQFDFKSSDESSDDSYQDLIGFRFFHESPGSYQIGLSFGHDSERKFNRGVKNMVGLDAFWTHKRYEISGEFLYRFGVGLPNASFDALGRSDNLWGMYLQGVAPVWGNLYAVARYEAFQREGAKDIGNLWVTGLAYRPLPPLVFKAEYRYADYDAKNQPSKIFGSFSEGFAASIAVMF
jgi:hypothetical protein